MHLSASQAEVRIPHTLLETITATQYLHSLFMIQMILVTAHITDEDIKTNIKVTYAKYTVVKG